jgi:nitric oxide reductase NorD protein
MALIDIEPWEPEETVGKIWHAYASRLDQPISFEGAGVDLEEVQGRLAIFFRGLGGAQAVDIKASPPQALPHRLSWKRSLGHAAERMAITSFDGESLRLPNRVDDFDSREANTALYFWLTAVSAFARAPLIETDPLRSDIRALQSANAMTRAVLAQCPGLRSAYAKLMVALRNQRQHRGLPIWEAAVEAAILHLLGDAPPDCERAAAIAQAARSDSATLTNFVAPIGYKPFMPVALWPNLRPLAVRQQVQRQDETSDDNESVDDSEKGIFRGKRKNADIAERQDSLILHKFEAIFSWTEFLNINRRIEDDDDDNAKKATDDQDEISLTQVSKKTATRLKLHLDLSPEDADRERLSGTFLYPEWDHRASSYIEDHCRVLEIDAEASNEHAAFLDSREAKRRIRAVRRQFEALRPRRVILAKQVEGEDLDIEAAVDARITLKATGEHSDRVYRSARTQERDLAVSILLDVSRSTESAVSDRTVIEVEQEALIALAWGLSACGDQSAIHAFSSLRRDRVFIQRCKTFEEPMSEVVEARITRLRPGFYTRLGAAIRHVSHSLARRSNERRLLLIITDGKPNDLDHYEGRHGIEDSRMAIREARRLGQSVFGVTVDAKAQSTFTRIFGRGAYSVVPDPEKLSAALPDIYRHLVSG